MLNRILTFFQHAKIADIADIGIIAVFCYLILVWLKKARARFIFIGMIMMSALYILARLFGLYLTTVALQTFFAVALIVIAIIFQDDLRHLFERIAIFSVARRHRVVTPFTQNVEILGSALANLSRKRIGVLIVVRGTDLLERHLEAGVVLDAVISEVLLESIFDRHVPSHDGAVIVDAGRITKLGCHLPLSTNIKEIGRLGTRHAAALGITERTDALSLVVSEEEGSISVAENGRIRNLKDITQLNNTLQDFYRRKFPEKKKTGLKRFLMEHYPEKIIAVLIACSLWVVFGHRTENVRRDFVVPIEYRNLPADRIINEPKTKEVTVTLGGNEQEFNLLKPQELKISLDMSGIKDGENEIGFSNDLVRNTSALSIVNIDPAQIIVNSYRLVPLTVPVKLKTKGKLPSEVVARSMKVEPESLSIMAPSTMPRDKINIDMEPIDLTSVKQTTTITPKLIFTPDIRFSGDKNPDLKVIIEVEKKEKPNG
ncbi:MAG: diadenylate cyclase [Candidatus Omnitrophica bacterium]|nr:diadenylate cyclase [Candidatus Omnitrophota bacterium]